MIPVETRKRIVTEFLQRCLEYADEMLARYRVELDGASGMQALAVQDKISHWTAYRAFTEYTIEALQTAELDPWLERMDV